MGVKAPEVTGEGGKEAVRKEIVQFLQKGLKQPHFDCKASAVLALGKMKEKTAGPHVLSFLRMRNPTVRESAALGLGMMEYGKAVPVLMKVLENPKGDKSLRVCAALALGMAKAESAGPLLLEILNRKTGKRGGENLEVQCAACYALGVLRHADGWAPLVRIIRSADSDENLRATAVSALPKFGKTTLLTTQGEISIPQMFMNLLRTDSSAMVRRSAVLALGGVWVRGLGQSLALFHRQDPDLWVRCLSLLVLAEHAGKTGEEGMARKIFRGLIEKPRDRSLRDVAMISAGLSQDEEALPLLRAILKEEDYGSSWAAAAMGLAFLKDEESLPEILKGLHGTGNPYKKAYACMAIALLGKGNEQASVLLKGILAGKTHPHLRATASMALARIGDDSAVAMLLDMLPKVSEPSFRKMTAISLRYFRNLNALPVLKSCFEGKKTDKETKAMILVAVGCLGDEREVPILREISSGYNFLLPFPKLYEILIAIM
ncbi:MAG: HEAT repeat domain-containing protein [Planctomycetota bacterium]